jgi:hypothetical protein
MSLELEAATPDQLDEIAELLCKAFGAAPDAAFADRRLLYWKYFASAQEVWNRPLSFVLSDAGCVVAHCAMAPNTLHVPHAQRGQEVVGSVSPMDWVSAGQPPGAGLLLMKQLIESAEVAILVGGSDATRAVIRKLGFAVRDSVDTFARVVRPFLQRRTRPAKNRWIDTARLLRNTAWSLVPAGSLSVEWTATPVEKFTETTRMVPLGVTVPEHGVEFLNYWLRCPVTRIDGYEIRRRDARIGHFLLSYVAGQTRIADLQVCSSEISDWKMAYRLAMNTAASDEQTGEVVALASTALARQALSEAGFRRRGSVPMHVYDPKNKLAANASVHWSFVDDDAAYLHDAAHPYST